MPTFFSPEGNPEIWAERPEGYLTEEEWVAAHPDPEPEPPTLDEARASALARLNSAFAAAEASGKVMSSAGFVIDATERSNRDIEGLITSMEATSTPETTFCAADNSFHTVTLEQLRTMRLEVIAYGQALYARKWELRAAIESAESVAEVQVVDINFDGVSA